MIDSSSIRYYLQNYLSLYCVHIVKCFIPFTGPVVRTPSSEGRRRKDAVGRTPSEGRRRKDAVGRTPSEGRRRKDAVGRTPSEGRRRKDEYHAVGRTPSEGLNITEKSCAKFHAFSTKCTIISPYGSTTGTHKTISKICRKDDYSRNRVVHNNFHFL